MFPVKCFFQPTIFSGAKIAWQRYVATVCFLYNTVWFIFEILQRKFYEHSTHGRYDGKW
jgi:hypothetical protein